jgi:hypothetical protein
MPLPCLAEGELVTVLAAVPRTKTTCVQRDRVRLARLARHGLCTVEVVRANVQALSVGNPLVLRVRGKPRDRLLPLRPDLATVLQASLTTRGTVI